MKRGTSEEHVRYSPEKQSLVHVGVDEALWKAADGTELKGRELLNRVKADIIKSHQVSGEVCYEMAKECTNSEIADAAHISKDNFLNGRLEPHLRKRAGKEGKSVKEGTAELDKIRRKNGIHVGGREQDHSKRKPAQKGKGRGRK